MSEYVKPEFKKDAFNCPHCGVYSQIRWHEDKDLKMGDPSGLMPFDHYCFAQCEYCKEVMCFVCVTDFYLNEFREWTKFHSKSKMLYPKQKAISPTKDMPEKVKEIYEEASLILGDSPRASCALLRLALQELIKYLKENIDEYNQLKCENLRQDINQMLEVGNFHESKKETLQEAMNSIRLIGNKVVHPSELDINDDPEIASILFEMINFIVEEVITKPKAKEEKLKKLQGAIGKNSQNGQSQ